MPTVCSEEGHAGACPCSAAPAFAVAAEFVVRCLPLQEGRYGLTLRAADKAGLVNQVGAVPARSLPCSVQPLPVVSVTLCSLTHQPQSLPAPLALQTQEYDVFVDFTPPVVSSQGFPEL